MKLRSGTLVRNNASRPKRKIVRKMVNPPNNNGEQPPHFIGENTATVNVIEAMPSTVSMTVIPSSVQSGPVLSSPVRTHGQPLTPRLVGTNSFRLYVIGFTIPMNDCEKPYGMSTSTMANLHNSTSTITDPMVIIILPLQGSESAVNNLGRSTQTSRVGFSAQLSTFTTNSAAVLR